LKIKIRLGELFLVFLAWTLFDIRAIDYIFRFKGSYVLLSLLISFSLIFWLKRTKDLTLNFLPAGYHYPKLFSFYFLCVIILIPLGLNLRFIKFNFSLYNLAISPLVFIGIYASIALIEELVFRQILLVYFEQKMNYIPSLLLSSLIFGLYHVNNHGFPSWEYVVLASIAGIIYGLTFKRLGFASVLLLHSLVDVSKFTFFTT